MRKITLSRKRGTLMMAFLFSALIFSTASTIFLQGPQVTAVITQPVCATDATGAIDITVSGTGPFLYNWSKEGDMTFTSTNEDLTNITVGTYTVTVTQGDGSQIVSDPFVVTPGDSEPPVITPNPIAPTPADSGLCEASGITPSATASDNCSVTQSPSGSRTDGLALTDPYPVGTTDIIWTVTDVNGNTGTVTQTVTITDDQAPVAVAQNITIQLDASGQAVITPSQINNGSTDNCTNNLSYSLDISSFTCADIGDNPVVLSVSDGTNTTTAPATVTVEDNTPPVITPVAATFSTDSGVCYATISEPATATDNCTLNQFTGVRDDGLPMSDPYPKGTTVVTWTAVDEQGNSTTLNQDVIVVDNEPPVITPTSITEPSEPGKCSATVNVQDPPVTDNCDSVVDAVPYRDDGLAYTQPYPVGTTIITWRATDSAGNMKEETQIITVEDREAPVVTVAPEITTSCEITVPYPGPAEIGDNCTPDNQLIVTTNDPLTYYPQNNKTVDTITWEVKDLYGNITTVQQKIIIDPIITDISVTPVTCNGGVDGGISVQASGGASPYTYALDAGDFTSNPVFTNLAGGTYVVKVKDQTNCIREDVVTVPQPDPIVYTPPADGVRATVTPESCAGTKDGSILIQGDFSGGTGPYMISIDNTNFTTDLITDLSAGTYDIYVKDSKGCRMPDVIAGIVVDGPDPLTADIAVTNASCYQTNTGRIDLSNPSGGNGSLYSFRINGGPWQTNATPTGYSFIGLSAGSYVLEMKDEKSCSRVLDTINIVQPDQLQSNLVTTRTTTYGTATGTASVSPAGGNGSYTYVWKNASGTIIGNTKSINNLKAGNYSVTVTDGEGCQVTTPFTIYDAVTTDITAISICKEPDDLIRTSTFQVQMDKTRGGSGNPSEYTYSWNFGEGASLPPGTTGVGPFEVYYSVPGEKSIILTITDTSGVSSTHVFNHYVGECFETCDSSQNFESNNNSFYIGDANGVQMDPSQCDDSTPLYLWFIVTKSSNVYRLYSEFIYTISDGTSTQQYRATDCFSHPDLRQVKPGDKVQLNRVGTGENELHWSCGEVLEIQHITYKWTNNSNKPCGDTEKNMCASTNEVIKVATPISAEAIPTNTCYGESEGAILINGFGGTGDFIYTAVNTSTDPDTNYWPQTLNVFNDLPAGNFTVTITDNKEVADSLGQEQNTITITDIMVQQPSSAVTATVTDQDVSCYGFKDGRAIVTPQGGAMPPEGTPRYTYLWNDPAAQTDSIATNLGPGNYTVTVTDTWGCAVVKSVTITQPVALTKAYAGQNQTLCGYNSTNMNANTPTSGVGTWSISYKPEGTNPVFTDPSDPKTLFTAPEGKYVLVWTIASADGSCPTTDQVAVTILNECNYLNFDGLDDYIDMGTGSYDFTSGSYSIEGWIKPGSTSGTRTILGKRDVSGSANNGYVLSLTNGGYPTFSVAGKTIIPNLSVPLNTERWYHLAITYNGSKLIMYIDGIQVQSTEAANPAPSSAPFLIGASFDSASPRGTKSNTHFNGWIEEVRLWKTDISVDQIRFMMNQRLEKYKHPLGLTFVKGVELPMNVPGPLSWSVLAGYYRLVALEAAAGGGTTADLSNDPVPGLLKNITSFQENSAPLPYVSKRDGTWRDIDPETTPWLYGRGRWDAPNSLGLTQQPITWNIVRVSHKISSGNGNITVLGLLSEERLGMDGSMLSELSIYDPNSPINEYNPGHALIVTDYLKLNGAIDLIGESQLIQTEGSILEESSTGYLERDQQGMESSFNYNYWSSPVGPRGSSNLAPYSVGAVLKDGSDPANPGPINFNYQYHWADNPYTGDLRISTYWLHKFTNSLSNTYSQWYQVKETGTMLPAEGFSMKGPTGYAPLTAKQNYTFKGKPYNGTITKQITAGNDYLVGNPYPSAINGYQFIRDNISTAAGGNRDRNVFNGVLYFWDHFGGQTHYLKRYIGGYATLSLAGGTKAIANDERINATGQSANADLNPQQFIPVGQGFFVSTSVSEELQDEANIQGGSIIFRNSQRVFETEHQINDRSIFKSREEKHAGEEEEENRDNRMKIYLKYRSPEGFHRQLLVTADSTTSAGFDLGYDAPLIEDIDEDMYWMINDVGFVIQAIPGFTPGTELPLMVKIHEEGEFMISIDTLMNIPEDLQIHLKDSLDGSTHDLRKSAFKLTEAAGAMKGRFSLVFPEPEVPVVEQPEDPLAAEPYLAAYYSSEESIITIENPHELKIYGAVLYTLTGQQLEVFHEIPDAKMIELAIPRKAAGVYVLKVVTDSNEVRSVKFIIE